MIRVDGDTVRHRRLALGIGAKRLAGACRVSLATLNSVESGTAADVDLRFVQKLADALSLAPLDILTDPEADGARTPADTTDRTGDDGPATEADARTLGALLHARPANHPVGGIADALRWPVARVQRALVVLEPRLAGTGTRLNTQKNRYRVAAADSPEVRDAAARLDRSRVRRRGFGLAQGTLLVEGLRGTVRPAGRGRGRLACLGRLVNDGYLVETDDGHGYVPGPTVVDAVTPGGRPAATLDVPAHAPLVTATWRDEGRGQEDRYDTHEQQIRRPG